MAEYIKVGGTWRTVSADQAAECGNVKVSNTWRTVTNSYVKVAGTWRSVCEPAPTPTPVAPTPVAPTPVAPTPVAPTPVAPTPVAPTPVAPTPVALTTYYWCCSGAACDVNVGSFPSQAAANAFAADVCAPFGVSSGPTTSVINTCCAPTPVAPTPVAPTPVAPTPVAGSWFCTTSSQCAGAGNCSYSQEITNISQTGTGYNITCSQSSYPNCQSTTCGPTPVAPTPVAPTPVAPTPVAPTPVAPTPVAPTPVAPTPVAPTPVAPTPVAPTPTASCQGQSCEVYASCNLCGCCPDPCIRIGTYNASCQCTNLGGYLC